MSCRTHATRWIAASILLAATQEWAGKHVVVYTNHHFWIACIGMYGNFDEFIPIFVRVSPQLGIQACRHLVH